MDLAYAWLRMRQGWRVPATALFAVCLVLAAACGARISVPEKPVDTITAASTPLSARDRRAGPHGNGASTGPVIRLGAALSLSGSAVSAGLAQRSGIKLAQDEINAGNLLDAARLDIVVENDASDRDQATTAFQKFIDNDHVAAIMGPTLSDVALSVDPLAQQAGVPVLAISNAAGGVTEIGNFIFRNVLSESQLAPQIVKQVRSKLKLHHAALLYTDTDANRSGSHGFKDALQERGVQIVAEQAFEPGSADVSSQLREIATARPDALFVTAPSGMASTILIQARQAGLDNVPIVGSNAFNSASVLRAAGQAAEGVIVGSGWSITSTSPRNQQFIAAYRARYGTDPDQFAAQAYTGVYILAAAIKDAGNTSDPHVLRDALARVQGLDTPLGTFAFDDARDAAYAPIVQIVRNGVLELF